MFVPTLYLPSVDLVKKTIEIPEIKLHHLINVLRIKNNSSVNISNGQGFLAFGHLINENVEIMKVENFYLENKISIAVPYLREKNRFRFMIEKLVELNTFEINLVKTTNTQNTNTASSKIISWAESAVEQSGTPFFPKFNFDEELDYNKFSNCFDISGINYKKNNSIINNFAIGPEGGWTNKELANFSKIYSLSNFSLRTETAAITAVSLMM